MITQELSAIREMTRHPAPAITPQALAWHDGALWMGSRDLRRVYRIDVASWKVTREFEPPGIPWAAVSSGDALRFTIGEGDDDDRYIWRCDPGSGFSPNERLACPELTGSYLSYDGKHLYLSQWYNKRILQLDGTGKIQRLIDIGAEICGHTFADGVLYVLRGVEKPDEDWRIARLDPREVTPRIEDVAKIPFASRSLTFDGTRFWSNHRAANEIVSFVL